MMGDRVNHHDSNVARKVGGIALGGLVKLPVEVEIAEVAARLWSRWESLGTPKLVSAWGHCAGGIRILVEQFGNPFL